MPKFSLDQPNKTVVTVAKKQVFYQCRFNFPEDYKERNAYSKIAHINGDLVMGFYTDPVPGDEIRYEGFQWALTKRIHQPTRRNSRDEKWVTILVLEFIGEVI